MGWSKVNLRYERLYNRMIGLGAWAPGSILRTSLFPCIEEEVAFLVIAGAAAMGLFFGVLSYGPAVKAWFKRVTLRRRGYPY